MAHLITAALIVRDEAAFLPDCLASIAGTVDEIVVVDTRSADDSPAIAAGFGARVHHEPWRDDFAAARNTALGYSTGQWILYIDADERLAPVRRPELEKLLAGADEVAFRLLLQPNTLATPYREYRLWRNDQRIRFVGAMHEKVVPSIHAVAEADGRPIGVCDLLLTHVGYEGDQTRKHRRNLPLLRSQLRDEPGNLFNWHHLYRVHAGLGDTQEAERVLRLAVGLARAQTGADPAGVLAYGDLVALQLARDEDAQPLLDEALVRYPRNWQLVWLQSRAHLAAGRYEAAVSALDRLLTVEVAQLPDEGPSYDRRLFGELAHEGRGLCLFRLGRYAEAADAYAAAARCAPGDPGYPVKRDLALARCQRKEAGV
jgi:glycosyltransferase involved in cell wall biosynthesis